MSTFKCKMCGGTLEIQPGESVAVCDSCGSKQTIPNLSDERRANLYDRANHFRRANEFDKAMGLYEQILNEDNSDSEAHWSVVLCRYGIEYVEDPATHKRVPTVNRTQYTSILSDEDYKAALRLADGYQRDVYQAEAKAIDEIQKGILAISQKEEPFDVFISYKETDATGRRTPDSVLATDLYHQLTKEGFKVFLSRITLEDKLGQEYEPYIFAALNSAKVMVVVGTKPEYFNAVWVKNEWSRYLALIRSGEKKTLIPAYRDMDPYDLPDEFSHLMAQDMSKLGFMQDLIRGIKKLTETEKAKSKAAPAASAISMTGTNTGSLLKRAFIFLEDGDFKEAVEYAERVLDYEPENVQAYLVKLMVEQRVNRQEMLKDCAMPFDGGKTYQRLMRYADSSLKAELQGYNKYIRERNEENRKAAAYDLAFTMMNAATTENAFLEAAEAFKDVSGYRDGNLKQKLCIEKAEECRKDVIYNNALHLRGQNSEESYKKAIEEFETIRGWRESKEQIVYCRRRIEEIKAEQEQKRVEQERKAQAARIAAEKAVRKRKKTITALIFFALLVAGVYFAYIKVFIPAAKYSDAQQMMEKGDYAGAYQILLTITGYKDVDTIIKTDKKITAIVEYLAKYEVGKIVEFGAFEQDNNIANGKEPVEWVVLTKDGNKALLLSKYALDCQPYNSSIVDITWEKCSLRSWLNGTFLNAAFKDDELKQIITSKVTADRNTDYSTDPGEDTTDKVFLLSITEAKKYFSTDGERQCTPTAYAKAKSNYVNSDKKTCWWWLRSPGFKAYNASYVNPHGAVSVVGYDVNYGTYSVRPALWINLDA